MDHKRPLGRVIGFADHVRDAASVQPWHRHRVARAVRPVNRPAELAGVVVTPALDGPPLQTHAARVTAGANVDDATQTARCNRGVLPGGEPAVTQFAVLPITPAANAPLFRSAHV
jgi:hypothetical protein